MCYFREKQSHFVRVNLARALPYVIFGETPKSRLFVIPHNALYVPNLQQIRSLPHRWFYTASRFDVCVVLQYIRLRTCQHNKDTRFYFEP